MITLAIVEDSSTKLDTIAEALCLHSKTLEARL
jgi:hypothetical protein